MLDMMLKCYVDLSVIRDNVRRLSMECPVILMLKADAYGHGLVPVAKTAERYVDSFGVVTLEEGEQLRLAGISKDILVTSLSKSELYRAAEYGLTIGLNNFAQLDGIARLPLEVRKELKAHIKFDTGMRRLGFKESDLVEALERIKALGVKPTGVYSHMRNLSYKQAATFERMCKAVRASFPDVTRHLAASHTMKVKRLRYDAVRVGIEAYRGAMTVVSEVISSRRADKGDFVSYGNFRLKKPTNLATVFGGYADGISRYSPSSALIRGNICKVVGKVCMDMFCVDCGDFLPAPGEEVVLLDPCSVERVARERRTIDYTVMTCWKGRVKRIYFDNESGS